MCGIRNKQDVADVKLKLFYDIIEIESVMQ